MNNSNREIVERCLGDSNISILESSGWTIQYVNKNSSHEVCDAMIYKTFPSEYKCNCNYDKEGIQVIIRVFIHSEEFYPESIRYVPSFELDISGELEDESWVRIFQWAIDSSNISDILKLVPRAVKTWEFIRSYKED